MFPHVDWGFVFVDDFCWLLRTDTPTEDTAKLLLFLAALGCPLSWHKTALSEVNTWLGFQVNPCGPIVDFPPDNRQTLEALLQTIATGNTFTAKEIERALVRLNWATAAWPLSRPFLQPFWNWKSAATTSGKPGKLIRTFALLLLQLLRNPQIQPCPYDPASNWGGASDASAHPEDGAYIGGWIADCENPSKDQTWQRPVLWGSNSPPTGGNANTAFPNGGHPVKHPWGRSGGGGQPFHLQLITALAAYVDDIENVASSGVPLGEAPRLGLAVFLIRPAGWCIAPCLCPLRLYFWALLVCFPPRPIPCFGWHWWPFSLCGLLPPLNWDDGHHRPLVCLGVPWPSWLTCGQTGKRFSCQWAGATPHHPSDFSEQGEKIFA